jgi:hypothetical protein
VFNRERGQRRRITASRSAYSSGRGVVEREAVMEDLDVIERVKITIGCIALVIVGVALIATGEPREIAAGCGALLCPAVLFGYIRLRALPGESGAANTQDEQPTAGRGQIRLRWLGICLTLAAGLVYVYLPYSMDRFDAVAVAFASVPLLLAGLGCIAISFSSARNS